MGYGGCSSLTRKLLGHLVSNELRRRIRLSARETKSVPNLPIPSLTGHRSESYTAPEFPQKSIPLICGIRLAILDLVAGSSETAASVVAISRETLAAS